MQHNQNSSCSYSEAVTQIQVQASILLRKTACARLLGEGTVCLPLSPSKANLGDIVYKGYILYFINSTHNCLISFLLIHYGNAINVIFLISIYTLSVCAQSLIRVQPFATPWTIASQAPLSMGFSRQENWSGLPFPTPGDLPREGNCISCISSIGR